MERLAGKEGSKRSAISLWARFVGIVSCVFHSPRIWLFFTVKKLKFTTKDEDLQAWEVDIRISGSGVHSDSAEDPQQTRQHEGVYSGHHDSQEASGMIALFISGMYVAYYIPVPTSSQQNYCCTYVL